MTLQFGVDGFIQNIEIGDHRLLQGLQHKTHRASLNALYRNGITESARYRARTDGIVDHVHLQSIDLGQPLLQFIEPGLVEGFGPVDGFVDGQEFLKFA